MNTVTIFSKGLSHFRREFVVGKETVQKNIPVKIEDLDSVVSSLEVFGNVNCVVPPSYIPEDTSARLQLDGSGSNSLWNNLSKLSGANVEVSNTGANEPIKGRLVGVQTTQNVIDGTVSVSYYAVVYDKAQNRLICVYNVYDIKFTDEQVQQEIRTALERNYQNIKPGTTAVELQLKADKDNTPAAVEYMIPMAAWKMCYALRLNKKSGNRLTGTCIIDNNTDEDLVDFKFNVVTGDPITFKTNLSKVVSVKRGERNVISEDGVDPISVNEVCDYDGGAGQMMLCSAPSANTRMYRKTAVANAIARPASKVESQDVGDFEIFSIDSPMTIYSKKSAMLPVFDVNAGDVNRVLFYDYDKHQTRPWKAVEFENKSGHGLNKSKITVYEDDVFAGEVEIDSLLRKEEKRILPYGLSNDVAIKKLVDNYQTELISVKVVNGVCTKRVNNVFKTHYSVQNLSEEEKTLYLDHNDNYAKVKHSFYVKGDEVKPSVTKTKNGIRLNLVLNPNDSYTICVKEIYEEDIDYQIDANINNVYAFIQTNDTDVRDKLEKAFVKVKKLLAAKISLENEINLCKQEIEKQNAKIKQATEVISSMKGVEATVDTRKSLNKWLNTLDTSSEAAESFETKLFEQQKELSITVKHLNKAVQEIEV